MSIEKVYSSKNELVSIIVRARYKYKGVKFVTPNNLSQQLGFISYPKNYIIKKHKHRRNLKKVFKTKETLLLLEGVLKVMLYNNKGNLICYKILKKNDIIMLITGWHEFKIIKKIRMIEVKQGPYSNLDKIY